MLPETIFRHRRLLTGVALSILVYCNLYLWLFIPFSPFEFNWRPDHQMRVQAVPDDSTAAGKLMEGDQIVAIDGRQVQRTAIFFPPSLHQDKYTLTIERAGTRFDVIIDYLSRPDSYAIQLRAASGLLSLICWGVGALVLRFSWPENRQAIWLGAIFLLASIVVTSWNGTLMGVPLTWLTSQPLLFLLAVGWIYLGLLPHYNELRGRVASWLRIVVGGALALCAVAIGEAIFLFPQGVSLQSRVGLSIYQLGALSQAGAGLLMFVLLIGRRIRAKSSYLRQQLNILLFFVGFGFLPAILLSFLPLAVWGNPILPIPIAMLALLAVPIGYFYVIFRHSYLNFDRYFGEQFHFFIVACLFTILYALGLRAFDEWLGESLTVIQQSMILFFLIALITPYGVRGVSGWIHALFFGRTPAAQEELRRLTNQLALQPDIETLETVVQRICELLDIPKAVLALKNGGKVLRPTIKTAGAEWPRQTKEAWSVEHTLVRETELRKGNTHPIFQQMPWAQIVLPIQARDEMIGVWVLSRPTDGFLHHEAVRFLELAAGTLAIGSEVILLLDSAEYLSRQIISVQEEEQNRFATRLHDQPLQQLYAIRLKLVQQLPHYAQNNHPLKIKLKELSDDLAGLESELRALYQTSNTRLFEQGIETTIERLIEDLRTVHRIEVDSTLESLQEIEDTVPENYAPAIYHIVREAFNNIVKHSGATLVEIVADSYEATLRLTITDNGIHRLPVTMSEAELLRRQHFGIVGMKSQAKSINGRLSVSPHHSGTKVSLVAPLL